MASVREFIDPRYSTEIKNWVDQLFDRTDTMRIKTLYETFFNKSGRGEERDSSHWLIFAQLSN